jgi:hypothetical protein
LMSRAAVAYMLDVSAGTVDRYCKVEGLPFMKVVRRVLFRRTKVEKWLGEREGNGGGGRGGARG